MTNKQCNGDHSTFKVLIIAAAGLAVLGIIFSSIDGSRLRTVGDAVCADAGHGPFVSLDDGVIRCEIREIPTGHLDGLDIQAVAPP